MELKGCPKKTIEHDKRYLDALSEFKVKNDKAIEDEAHRARVKASLEDVKAGRVKRFKKADDLLKVIKDEWDE